MAMHLINPQHVQEHLVELINKEMQAAAEPILQKALEDVERAMRQRMASMFIALIDSQFSIDKFGTELRILVKHEKR